MPCVRLALGGKLGAGRETSRGTGDHMWRAVVEGSGGVVEASGGGAVDREQETGDRGQGTGTVECGMWTTYCGPTECTHLHTSYLLTYHRANITMKYNSLAAWVFP